MIQQTQRIGQTTGEEFCNVLTHALGAGMAIAATAFLLEQAVRTGSPLTVASMAIYGASLILLFLNSAVYHAILPSRVKSAFQVLDHCSIYLLILGTYTPVCLNLIGGAPGWTMFAIVAGCAVLGITLNCISVERFHRVSQLLYLASGWTALLALVPLSRVLTPTGWALLLSGGLSYTVGVLFYRDKKHPYMHFIWHLFVLGGAVPHFLFVYWFCL
ncbi:MAG: hemolysin III family protein [Butyricicoccus sp.]